MTKPRKVYFGERVDSTIEAMAEVLGMGVSEIIRLLVGEALAARSGSGPNGTVPGPNGTETGPEIEGSETGLNGPVTVPEQAQTDPNGPVPVTPSPLPSPAPLPTPSPEEGVCVGITAGETEGLRNLDLSLPVVPPSPGRRSVPSSATQEEAENVAWGRAWERVQREYPAGCLGGETAAVRAWFDACRRGAIRRDGTEPITAKSITLSEFFDRLAQWKASRQWRDGKVLHLTNFLERGTFLEPVPAEPANGSLRRGAGREVSNEPAPAADRPNRKTFNPFAGGAA